MTVEIIIGDCRTSMDAMEPDSIDSCVTDPPYHLTSIHKRFAKCGGASRQVPKKHHQYHRLSKGFMGQSWDGGDVAFQVETWAAVYRVLKPGAHLVAFSGTRTYHRMVCAIEDAGFEIRDQLAWCYGSGFPKSHNQPDGWGTALKPAWEPICLARKPLDGTVAANMAAHGTGALNIDGCRIDAGGECLGGGAEKQTTASQKGNEGWTRPWMEDPSARQAHAARVRSNVEKAEQLGRWPANIIHDGSEEVLAGFPAEAGAAAPVTRRASDKFRTTYGAFAGNVDEAGSTFQGDSGSAARFFYCAKATSAERGDGNNHPTVKPVELMRWLCRLVTPKGGTVLDPFAGSGSTLIAADREQFNAIGCELSPDYAEIANRRLSGDRGALLDAMERVA